MAGRAMLHLTFAAQCFQPAVPQELYLPQRDSANWIW